MAYLAQSPHALNKLCWWAQHWLFPQTCYGEAVRVLEENLSQNKIFISLALHIFEEVRLLHLPRCIFLAHQKARPAGLNSTNTFQAWVCTKNSIRYSEVSQINETQTKPLKTFNSVGSRDVQTALIQSRTKALLRGCSKRSTSEAL